MRKSIIAAMCITVLGLPAAAQGQAPARQGLWWSVGPGYGWAYVSCDICDSYRDRGLSATGRVGGTLSRSVLLGAELNGWTRSEEEVDEYLGIIGVATYWYPNPRGGFHLKGGLSYVAYRIDDGEDAITSTGFGPQLGLGYDFRVARRFSIQPYVSAVLTLPTATIDFNGNRQADGGRLSLIHAGLALHWH